MQLLIGMLHVLKLIIIWLIITYITQESSGELDLFIKFIHFHHVDGMVTALVYIISDITLGKNSFEIQFINNDLSHSNSIGT